MDNKTVYAIRAGGTVTDTYTIPKSELDRLLLKKNKSYSITVSGAKDLNAESPNETDNYKLILNTKGWKDGVYILSIAEGTVKNSTITQNSNLTFTSSVMRKWDTQKPTASIITPSSTGQFKIVFSVPVMDGDALNPANYLLNGQPLPSNVTFDISTDQKASAEI